MRSLTFATLALLAALAALVASCDRDDPVRPHPPAPLALSIRFPAASAAQQIDSMFVSAFDSGNRRVAGPARSPVDPERRTFEASLDVPAGVALTVTAEAIGTYFFPNESRSEHGVIFFGAARGVTVAPSETARAEVSLQLFVPLAIRGGPGNDGLAHITWSRVPGAARYRVWERRADGIGTEPTPDTTVARCSPSARETRTYRARAENAFTAGAYTDSIRVGLPVCSGSATYFVTSVAPPDSSRDVALDARITVTFSEPVDAGTASDTTIFVAGALSEDLPHTLTWSAGGTVLTIAPAESWPRGDEIVVFISPLLRSVNGAYLDADGSTPEIVEPFLYIIFTVGNRAPPAPALLEPPSDAENLWPAPTLRWTPVTDPDGDDVSYDVSLARVPAAPAPIATGLGGALLALPDTLGAGLTYRWFVSARDSRGATSESQRWSFRMLAAPSPPLLSATPVSTIAVGLTWSSGAIPVARFRIERRLVSTSFALIDSVPGTIRQYTDAGLVAGTEYVYRVEAVNPAGAAYSKEVPATTPSGPPAPTGLAVQPLGPDALGLTWVDHASDEAGYEVWRRTGTAPYARIAALPENAQAFTDSQLAPRTTYFYVVRALDAYGYFSSSNEASGTTTGGAPAAPSGLVATAGAGAIALAWTDNATDEDEYSVERKTAQGGFAEIAVLPANATSFQDSGLGSGVTRTYRVLARNAFGASAPSGEATATTLVPPAAPASLTAQPTSWSTVALTWSDASQNEQAFFVERATGTGAFARVDSLPAGTQNTVDTGLSPSTAYSYRVRAWNAAGYSSYSNVAQATTHPSIPAVPSRLTAEALGPSQVHLAWIDNSTNESFFRIERRTGQAPFATLVDVTSGISYEDLSVAPATAYAYRVRAGNISGLSDPSNEAGATTPDVPPQPPSGLTAVPASGPQVLLSWTDASSNEDGFVVERRLVNGSFQPAVTVGPGVTSTADAAVSPAMTYDYRVFAFNASGSSGPTNTATATPPGWRLVSASGGPDGREESVAAYDAPRHRLIVYGGLDVTESFLGEVWSFDLLSEQWSLLTSSQGTSEPGGRYAAAGAGDPVNGDLWMQGGDWDGFARTLWRYGASSGWTFEENLGPWLAEHSMVFDSDQGAPILFGGYEQEWGSFANDAVYVYSPGAPWIAYTPQGAWPGTRVAHGAVYDPVAHEMVIFGGHDLSGLPLGDLWAWNTGQHTWTERPQGQNPPQARSNLVAICRPGSRQMVIFGGMNVFEEALADLQAYSLDSQTWTALPPETAAPPGGRWSACGAYDPESDRLILFGGQLASGALGNDLWIYQFLPAPAKFAVDARRGAS